MGNKITDNLKTGTLGELLVQLRLLQFNVQAAPPIKDSGNDLIAVRGEIFRSIQVKTTTSGHFPKRKLPKHYHIVALVKLAANDAELLLDESEIYLVPRVVMERAKGIPKDLDPFLLSEGLIDELFPVPA
jgi:hypothetical protein